MKTSEMFPESDWPIGYTKIMVDKMDSTKFFMTKERQFKEKQMEAKEMPIPG